MNIVKQLNNIYKIKYRVMSERIEQATGYKYHPVSLSNVAAGSYPVSDSLRYRLMKAFPSEYAQLTNNSIGDILSPKRQTSGDR